MFLQSHLRTSAFPQAYLPSLLSLAWLPTKDAFPPISSQLPSCGGRPREVRWAPAEAWQGSGQESRRVTDPGGHFAKQGLG